MTLIDPHFALLWGCKLCYEDFFLNTSSDSSYLIFLYPPNTEKMIDYSYIKIRPFYFVSLKARHNSEHVLGKSVSFFSNQRMCRNVRKYFYGLLYLVMRTHINSPFLYSALHKYSHLSLPFFILS